MTRDELILRTRQLIAEGERLGAQPSLTGLQTWLQLSDDLLATAWGTMDRYHLAWLMVGKPKDIVRGRAMSRDEEAAYVREVAEQKTAALRMSLEAVERQGMPFRGETGGIATGQGMGEVPGAAMGEMSGTGTNAVERAADGRHDAGGAHPPAGPGQPSHHPARSRDAAPARRRAPCRGGARGPRSRRPAPGAPAGTTAAMTDRLRIPAVGGVRDVPVPDPVARDYLLLALRLDQQLPGTVDAYFGPADLKAQVDMEPLRAPARLADDAAALRDRVATEVAETDRRDWLDRQLTALETLARVRAGAEIGYLDQVSRCFAHTPVRRSEALFDEAARALDGLLPGTTPLADRLAAWDDMWTVAPERVRAVVDGLVDRFRARAAGLFELPEGEALRLSLVHGQPWSGYNWYDGGFHSRFDLNLDLPIRLPALVATVAHETYPGHHLEHTIKERVLVEELGRLEASILLINTPECLISEGLAEAGRTLVVAPDELAPLLVELADMAGLDLASDAAVLADAAARAATVAGLRRTLNGARLNAALLLHEDGWPPARVLDYLVDVGRIAPEAAAKRMEFIDHPLWRLYVHVYPEGEALIRQWLDAAPGADRAARFGRLLREQLTPPAIAGELGAAGAAGAAG